MTIKLCCEGVEETILLPEDVFVLCFRMEKHGVMVLDGDYEWLSKVMAPSVNIERRLSDHSCLSLRALRLPDADAAKELVATYRGLVFMEIDLEGISLTATY